MAAAARGRKVGEDARETTGWRRLRKGRSKSEEEPLLLPRFSPPTPQVVQLAYHGLEKIHVIPMTPQQQGPAVIHLPQLQKSHNAINMIQRGKNCQPVKTRFFHRIGRPRAARHGGGSGWPGSPAQVLAYLFSNDTMASY